MSLLSVKNANIGYPLTKNWKEFFSPSRRSIVIEELSMLVEEGEILGLIGESGCGKTTLMKAILGQVPLTSGEILWKNRPIDQLPSKERARNIQFIFQNPIAAMNPKLNVLQILSEPLELFSDPPLSHELKLQRIEETMQAVGLPKRFLLAYPYQFSGGEAQRVAIARALVCQPKLLICDEPVSALDVSIQAKIINLLLDLNRRFKISIIFISHNLVVVRQLAHNVLVLYLGAEMEYGPMEALLSSARHPYTSALWSVVPLPTLKADQLASKFAAKDEEEIDSTERPHGCLFSRRCPYASHKCSLVRPHPKRVAPHHRCACIHSTLLQGQLWRPDLLSENA